MPGWGEAGGEARPSRDRVELKSTAAIKVVQSFQEELELLLCWV